MKLIKPEEVQFKKYNEKKAQINFLVDILTEEFNKNPGIPWSCKFTKSLISTYLFEHYHKHGNTSFSFIQEEISDEILRFVVADFSEKLIESKWKPTGTSNYQVYVNYFNWPFFSPSIEVWQKSC